MSLMVKHFLHERPHFWNCLEIFDPDGHNLSTDPNYDRSYPFYDSAYSERNHIKNDHIFLELSRLDTQQNAEVKDFGHHRNIYEIIFNSRPGKMWIKYTQIIYRYQFTLQVTQENYFSRQ